MYVREHSGSAVVAAADLAGTHLGSVDLRLEDVPLDPPHLVFPTFVPTGGGAAPIDTHHVGPHKEGRLANVLAYKAVTAEHNHLLESRAGAFGHSA